MYILQKIKTLKIRIKDLVRKIFNFNNYNDFNNQYQYNANFYIMHANDMIFITDQSGKIIEVNYKVLDIYKYSREEILKKNIRDLCSPKFMNIFDKNWSDTNKNKQGSIYEIMHYKKDGTYFPVEISSSVFFKNNILHRLEIVRDISLRKKYELKLHESRDLLKNLTDAIPGVVFIYEYTREGKERIVFVSDGVKDLYGISSENVILNVNTIVEPILEEDKQDFKNSIRKAIQNKEMWFHEFRINYKDTFKWLKGKAVLYETKEKNLQWYGLLTDVTKQKITEQDLLRERKLFIGGPLVAFRTRNSKELLIEYVSKNIIQFGFKLESFHTKYNSYYDIVHPEDKENVKQKIIESSRIGANYIEHEYYRIVSDFGKVYWISDFTVIIRSEWGDIKHYDVYIMDVTDRKFFEEELKKSKDKAEKASKVKSQFLANISHELRTPLNGILGYTQLLKKEKELNEFQKKGIQVIEQSGNHLLNLINDILDLSKIEERKIEIQTKAFAIKPFIFGIIEMVKTKSKSLDTQFLYKLDGNVPSHINTDARRLTQILLNLLSNALKFTKKGKVILKISYNTRQEKFTFIVADSGIGIPKEMLKEIFEPFKQANNFQEIEGSGLGLSITKKLIHILGEELRVKTKEGLGSVFLFKIKSKNIDWNVKETNNNHRNQIVGIKEKKPKVLIVDDKKDNRSVLVYMLFALGFKVEEASHGLESIGKAKKFIPDIILLDIILPGIDGFEVIQTIKQIPELMNVKILIISASNLYIQKIKDVHYDDFILKPVREVELLDKMAKLLDLEWIYGTEKKNIYLSEENDKNFTKLPDQVRENLKFILQKGNIKKFKEEIKNLKNLDEIYLPYINKIEELSNHFQVKQIIELLS